MSGSNIVLSRSYIWVNEYISFIYGLVFGRVCGGIGEMGVWKCIGVDECVAVLKLLWPRIFGLAGAYVGFVHIMVCWWAGSTLTSSPLIWSFSLLVEVCSAVSIGVGAGSAHSDEEDVVHMGAGAAHGVAGEFGTVVGLIKV